MTEKEYEENGRAFQASLVPSKIGLLYTDAAHSVLDDTDILKFLLNRTSKAGIVALDKI